MMAGERLLGIQEDGRAEGLTHVSCRCLDMSPHGSPTLIYGIPLATIKLEDQARSSLAT